MYSREVNHFILLNTITYSILIVQLFHLTIYNYYILHHKSILLNLESRKILKQILIKYVLLRIFKCFHFIF